MFCLNNGMVAAVGLCFVSLMAWWQWWDCVSSK